MVQIGMIEEIQSVKSCLEKLKQKGIIIAWELPYENLLTRLNAAIFFFTPSEGVNPVVIQEHLIEYPNASVTPHQPAAISQMPYKIAFEQSKG
ncbi:hypothetical protein [Paenibacillus aquistagni]|uniref:hypothetical protein n=1 Tax=Paenibacillus aquistagni TaxID=1852522 RepID=UPI00145BD25D|nr:hypothetical protein [Paenibacillus aquistagni]NMM55480.1 hypothetical protein [Paenibacillus aquistagni]